MIHLELKYIPGLHMILPVSPFRRYADTIKKISTCRDISVSTSSIHFRFETFKDVENQFNTLQESLRSDGFRIPEMFPFSAILWTRKQPSAEMWRLAPPGHLLVPPEIYMPGISPWLYEWDILCLTEKKCTRNRLSPIRSLLVIGDYSKECFFCGSHGHVAQECQNMWTCPSVDPFNVHKLSDIPPGGWIEHIKKAGGEKYIITTTLDFLKQDMRKIFTWNFAALLCRSSATYFHEFPSSPVKAPEFSRQKNLLEAVESQNMSRISIALNRADHSDNCSITAIMKGLHCLASGMENGALNAWRDAEKDAEIPMRRCYAALLQSRLLMLQKNITRAGNALSRAAEADCCPFVTYWSMLSNSLAGNRKQVIADFRSLADHPDLIAAALADPLLISCQVEIENTFRQIWKRQEDMVRQHVEHIENMLHQAREALGPELIRDAAISLRDWRGKWSRTGYQSLLTSVEFLDGLQNRILKEINHNLRKIMADFPAYENRCRVILSNLPRNAATRSMRNTCLEIMQELRDTKARSRTSNLYRLAGFKDDVECIADKFQNLNKRYHKYHEKIWQKKMAIRLGIYSMLLSMAIWMVTYLYELFIR